MKSHEDIRQEVYDVIARALRIDSGGITEASVVADLSADSIQLFELLLAFEKHYEIETSYDDVVRLHTVDDIIKYVARIKYAY